MQGLSLTGCFRFAEGRGTGSLPEKPDFKIRRAKRDYLR